MLSILEAYRTGRGRIVVRGKTEVELLDSKTKRTAVIIKEVVTLVLSVAFYMISLSNLKIVIGKMS